MKSTRAAIVVLSAFSEQLEHRQASWSSSLESIGLAGNRLTNAIIESAFSLLFDERNALVSVDLSNNLIDSQGTSEILETLRRSSSAVRMKRK